MMMRKITSCVMLMMMLMCVTEVSAQWSVTPEAGMNVTKYKDSPAAVGFKAGFHFNPACIMYNGERGKVHTEEL